MSRATFTFKTKEELRQMNLTEVNVYIRTLQLRTSFLSGSPRKSTEKQLEVAIRIRDSLSTEKEPGDA